MKTNNIYIYMYKKFVLVEGDVSALRGETAHDIVSVQGIQSFI